MADQDTSLPIRSEIDGTDERVHVKIVDGTNSPAVNQTEVDSDNNLHVEIHGNDPAGDDQVIRTSELGAVTPDGIYDASNNTKPGNVGVIASQRNASTDDTTQTERITSVTDGGGTVTSMDVALHDEDGEAYSSSNPMPVTVVDSEGSEINDYNTSAALASDASSNHDYTVTALKTFKLSQIWATASGKLKIEVQVETGVSTDSWTTKFVGFNSTANPNISITVKENIAVAAGVRVRIIRTNRDNQAQDVYSTISGHEI